MIFSNQIRVIDTFMGSPADGARKDISIPPVMVKYKNLFIDRDMVTIISA